VHGSGVGTLQAGAARGDAVEQGALHVQPQVHLMYAALARVGAREQPVGGGHHFQIEPFAGGLRLPLGFEIGAELAVFAGVFFGEDEGAGTQAIGEGVAAGGGLTRGSLRTGGTLGIPPVGFLLLLGNQHVNFSFRGGAI
jgi:hypothetical protein